MKKMFAIAMLLLCATASHAQNDVTRFLGIPVDGTQSEMIQKLRAKGYSYNSTLDRLEGEFNGRNVHIHVVTNNHKVWRIMVVDAHTSNETDIKIRFNTLCRQFQNNQKYIPASLSDYILSDEEDISYNMAVKNKRYEAAYYQLPPGMDLVAAFAEVRPILLTRYSQKQLSNPTDEIITAALELLQSKYSKKSVWFMINGEYGKYRIFIYYDNEYNHANGEDL